MKSYLNFEGLSRFLDNLLGLFVKVSDIITIYEIDEICGFVDYENLFVDIATGATYHLYVNNGSLNMAQIKNATFEGTPASEILLIDEATGTIYKLYIDSEKMSMESVNSVSSDISNTILVDMQTGESYKLYVNNGKLNMMEVD